MRRGLLIFLLINFLILAFLVRSVFTLITLLFEDASADAIQLSELPTLNSTVPIPKENQLIPKIIHQTYKDNQIPAHWQPAQKSCIDLHPDYEYKLWTDELSLAFIEKEYPWFLPTFTGYVYPIQRADAIRYFVLLHYGGVYLDLDDGCHRRLDPLLGFQAWVRRTVPTGISNDAMGAVPGHPFFKRVTEVLERYDRSWVLPYITIMGSTGPLFLSVVWKEWMGEHAAQISMAAAEAAEGKGNGDWEGRVRILMKPEYNAAAWRFFEHYRGSSWHGRDARLIFWMGKNWILLVAVGVMTAGVLGVGFWWAYGRLLVTMGARGRGGGAGLGREGRARKRSPSPGGPGRAGRWNWRWGRRRARSREQRYELLDQRDR